MKNKMKNIFIVASCFAAITCFSACDDWTEVENVNINTPGIEEQDPAAYAKYLQNLVAYKNSDHKVVYGSTIARKRRSVVDSISLMFLTVWT